MKKLLFIFAGVIFGLKSFSSPLEIETYGDSLTAGFLSHTSLTSPPAFIELGPMLGEIAFAFIQKDRDLIRKFEAPNTAWPHWMTEELKTRGKSIGDVQNLAVSGSKSSGIAEQVKKRGSSSKPTWAFLFVGQNDLCHVKGDTSVLVDQFRKNIESALLEWEKNHQDSSLFLMPTAPIYQLYPVLQNHVWLKSGQKTFTCQDAWSKYFPYCPSFYVRYKRGELESYLKPRGEALNQELEKIAHEWSKKSEKGNQYRFLDAQWPLPLQPQYFAMDCYHIAEPGQKIFARNIIQSLSDVLPLEETLRQP